MSIAESTMALGVKDAQVNLYVTFANEGNRRIDFWSPRYSKGYELLSFELQPLPKGVSRTVTRLPRAWDKNWPEVFSLPPGRHMTRPIALGDGTWEPLPLGTDKVGKFRIRAVFVETPERGDTTKVWLGRATSNWETVELRNHMSARKGF
ncbi:MAG: hypothetical protein JST30_16845 [Armatimonadetes bacterium]|nr:hypothetical protein [Armatimonadota bacterium]